MLFVARLTVKRMSEKSDLRVSMVEAYPPEVGSGLEGRSYGSVSEDLEREGFEIFFECRTGTLTPFQRRLFERLRTEAPRDLSILLDPIVASFAVKDACDLSGVDYVWLDLEGQDDFGNCTWARGNDHNRILGLAVQFLERHLDKYIIDAYDRRTREDMNQVWEAQLKLPECQVCGTPSVERRIIIMKRQKLRGWKCSNCGHHRILPSDALDYLEKR